MASIESLPPEVLLRIFSFLDKWELFDVEKVCRQWKLIVQEHVWSSLNCISAATIDYPDGDFVLNFIKIVHRVRSIKEIFTEVSPKATRLNKNPRMKEEMKKTLNEALKKLNSDAVFPMDFLQDIVAIDYPDINKWSTKDLPKLPEARKEVTKFTKQLDLGVFEVIKVNTVYVHGAKYSATRNPLVVSYKGKELVPPPLDVNRITRMNVGCVRVFISLEHVGCTLTTKTVNKQFLKLSKLELIDVDSFEFVYPSMSEEEHASVAIKLNFNPHRCQFTLEEFTSLLTILTKKKQEFRSPRIEELLIEWKKNNCIQSGEMTIHSAEFPFLDPRLDRGKLEELMRCMSSEYDGLGIILRQVFPSLITKLHLDVYHLQEEEEELLRVLQEREIFEQLKEFSLSLTDEKREEREDYYEETFPWELKDAVKRSIKMLNCLRNNLRSFERLEFDFTLSGKNCLSAMFDPIEVAGPLPHLQKLTYRDLPCFPFIISVVKQAPNLRYLYITSQNFEEEQLGVRWIKQLLDVLENNRELRTLTIRVFRNSRLYSGRYSPEIRRKEAAVLIDSEEDCKLLSEIDRQSHHLLSILPRLRRLLVIIGACGLHVEANRDISIRNGRPATNEEEYDCCSSD